MPPETDRAEQRGVLDRLLGLFAEVKAGESFTALLMFLNIFLILTAYYILKVVREALTITGVEIFGMKGDEIKAYLPAVMAVLLVGIVPAYGKLASQVDRLTLIKRTMSMVSLGLVGFFIWGSLSGVGTAIGLSFYIFLGIVNVFLIAQFWSYANDIYDENQGKRLFAIIAVGQSLGAVLGPKIAKLGADHAFVMLALSGGVFLTSIFLYVLVNRRVARSVDAADGNAEAPLQKGGGFDLIRSNRYLRYIALMILCTNVVNTTGEYILSNAARTKAEQEVPLTAVLGDAILERAADPETGELALTEEEKSAVNSARSPVVGRFYGDFFYYVNIVGLIVQMFVVSRIFKYFGVRAALFVLPLVAFAGYAAIGVLGGLLVLRVAKTAENSLDYSLQNTVKQALFLPTSREAKYKAKAAIDTFFVRFGDAASAALVAAGLHVLEFGQKEFAFVNVALCLVWFFLSRGIAKEHKAMTEAARAA